MARDMQKRRAVRAMEAKRDKLTETLKKNRQTLAEVRAGLKAMRNSS
ncbi:MAG: hypothetical protein ACREVA_07055 [Burkholderiales bacterium]